VDSNSKCFCAGIGYYKTKNTGDCNDFDAAINPSVENNGIEKCDGKDNDCDGKTDEGNPDKDNDKTADCVDTDLDGDGSVNWQDNCPEDANSDQKDMDNDSVGDVCDPDRDGDGKKNEEDNCPDKYNPLQQNIDKDSKGDACDEDMDGDGKLNQDDNCPKVPNEDQKDSDLDNIGDACDEDMDGDGVLDVQDNCPDEFNPDQGDFDKDLKGDACDMDADGDNYDKTVDCNDLNMNVKPGALEFCNSIDDDCDETVDDSAVDCIKFYKDEDNDNYGAVKDCKCLCGTAEPYDATNNLDCDDTNEKVNPKAEEECDGHDNDCDGQIDEEGADNCKEYSFDLDNDGWGLISAKKCLCQKSGYYRAENHGDCNDNDASVNPSMETGGDQLEITCNGKDDDCDGTTDELHPDMDNDGVKDCVDQDVDGDGVSNFFDNCPYTVNPDQKDTDADGEGDACENDLDGDGIADESDNCVKAYNPQQEDMDDDEKGDACDDDIDGDEILNEDDNCPKIANAPEPPATKQADMDADGIGDVCDPDMDGDGIPNITDNCPDKSNSSQSNVDGDAFGDACDEDADNDGYTSIAAGGTDCNDFNPGIHPNAIEVCNGLDDNCANGVDENAVNCVIYYMDFDHDNYGNPEDFKCLCAASEEYRSLNPSDCDDNDPLKNPQAQEPCDDIDNNCNGFIDEANPSKGSPCDGADSDFCKEGVWICNQTQNGLVCSDNTGDTPELCNGIDDDCDGMVPTNEGDSDGDGFRKCMGDCNDLDINIFPGYPYDDCMDGVDNNCDGVDGTDKDKDGYSSGFGCPDCDDNDPEVKPGATDTAGNLKDENCDGVDGVDADGDKYASEDSGGEDCDDSDKTVNPDAYDYKEGQCESWNNWALERAAKTGSVGEYLSMREDASGKLHISYYDRTYKQLRYLKGSAGSWQAEIVDTFAGTWNTGYGTSIALDSVSKPHIAYINSNIQLVSASKQTTSWEKTAIDEGNGTKYKPSITTDKNGALHIAYFQTYPEQQPDQTIGSEMLMHATDRTGTWHIQIVDENAGFRTGASSAGITADENGFLSIAYYGCGTYDSDTGLCSHGDLRMASDRTGIWTVTAVDTENDTGWNPSIAVDMNGALHVSYYESDNGDLKYAVIKRNMDKAVQMIDESGDSGKFSSLALDLNGHVFIAYHDRSLDKIKLARYTKSQWSIGDVYQILSLNHAGSFMQVVRTGAGDLNLAFWDELNEDLAISRSACMKAAASDNNCDDIDGIDADNDGFASLQSGGTDCDDSKAWVYPGADDIFGDGIDADCDGIDGADADLDGYADQDSGGNDCDDANPLKNPGIFDFKDGTCETMFFSHVTLLNEQTESSNIAVDSQNNPSIAYYSKTAGSGLRYAKRSNGTWAFINITTGGSVDSIALAMQKNDSSHISFRSGTDVTHSLLYYAANSSGSWLTVPIDTSGYNTGFGNSIAVDGNGYIHIAYINPSLVLQYASNTQGSWTIQPFAYSSYLKQTSIRTDTRNYVHIAANKSGGGILYFTNSGGYWKQETAVSAGSLTGSTALALDAQGIPSIAYAGQTDSETLEISVATSRGGFWHSVMSHAYYFDESYQYGFSGSLMIGTTGSYHLFLDVNAGMYYLTNHSGSWKYLLLDNYPWQNVSAAMDSTGAIHFAGDAGNMILRLNYGVSVCDKIASGGDMNCDGTDGMDADKDGFASNATGGSDCNDSDPAIKPGVSDTTSDNIFDKNCDGTDGMDEDHDGFASADSGGNDCGDTDSTLNPSAHESCDALDNDCDGLKDNGWSIDRIDFQGDTGKFVSLKADKFDRMHAAYYNDTNSVIIYAANSTGSWEFVSLSSFTKGAESVSAAADTNNRVHIAWYDSINGDLKYATDTTGSWVYSTVESINNTGSFASLVLDSDDKAHIAYRDVTNADLKYAANLSGTWAINKIDETGDQGSYSSIALGSDNHIHIAYYDATNADLKYATNASGTWAVLRIDSQGDAGTYASITLDDSEFVHIAYRNTTNFDLKYATNVSGSWLSETIDSAGNSGMYASIGIDSAGFVHIAHYDSDSADLRYTTNSSGSWITSLIAFVWDSGNFCSLVIDSNDKMYIGYYEAVNKDLMIASFACGFSCSITDKDNDGYDDAICSGNDCNDSDPQVHPDRTEDCNTSYDDNCTGTNNDNGADACAPWYLDGDFDGYGHTTDSKCLCRFEGLYTVQNNTDCDDNNAAANPSKTETCATAFDDDCNPANDNNIGLPSCVTRYYDNDGDGYYANGAASECRCYSEGKYTVENPAKSNDCNDNNPSVKPGAGEICDGIDNNCVSGIDENSVCPVITYYCDSDTDTYKSKTASGTCSTYNCKPADCDTVPGTDCDDSNAAANPSKTETCETAFDDDCNTANNNDIGLPSCVIRYFDSDQDGFYASGAASECRCTGINKFTSVTGGDCNDANDAIKPSAPELCDGIDNNCNSRTDDVWIIVTLDSTNNVGKYSSLRLDQHHKVHIAYMDQEYGYLKYMTNMTGSWNTGTLDYAGTNGGWISLSVDSDARAHISYYYSPAGDLKYATNVSGSWTYRALDTSGDVGQCTSIAMDTTGKVHISYYDSTNYDLKYGTKVSGYWDYRRIDTAGYVGSYSSIATDSDNKVHVSYFDDTSNDLKYATNTSGSWVYSTIDTSSNSCGQYTSTAIDSNNKVHISYFDNTNVDLKYATNTSGSWVTSRLDQTGNVGTYTSIAVDKIGKIHISYYDSTYSDLKYATNVSGSWVYKAVDTVGNVGSYTWLWIDDNSRVFISYYDTTNGDLKLATFGCGTTCTVPDKDGDSYIDSLCAGNDCDDNNSNVHPDAIETCLTSYDDDCDGSNNDLNASDCAPWYFDGDGDGYYIAPAGSECRCGPSGFYAAQTAGECDDTNAGRNPGRTETCITVFDDDCNSANDNDLNTPDCTIRYYDSDQDGFYANGAASECRCTGINKFTALSAGDCDDSNSAVKPGTAEVCDGIDNDCSGQTDNIWSIYQIDTAINQGQYSSIAVDSAGKVHISYYDDTNDDLKYVTNSTGSWIFLKIDSAGDVGSYSSIAADSHDRVHISYYDAYPNYNLKYATNEFGFWVVRNLDTSGDVGKYSSVAVDSADRVHISYYDATNLDLKYATNTSGSWVITALDYAGYFGKYSSIAVDNADRIHIAYYDNTVNRIRYATNTGGAWVFASADSGATAAGYVSIAADSQNKAHIVSAGGNGLRYTNNISGSWVTATLSTITDLSYSSIAVDSSDKVHISYHYYYKGGSCYSGDYYWSVLKYISNTSGSWMGKSLDGYENSCSPSYPPSVGSFSSIDTDKDNRVYVSYIKAGKLNITTYGCGAQCAVLKMDRDNDGFNDVLCGGNDCNDFNQNVNPSAVETCDTEYDDDCDGTYADKDAVNCSAWYFDGDHDEYYAEGALSECHCGPSGNYTGHLSGDCADNNALTNPGRIETCETAFDDDCNQANDNDLNLPSCTVRYWEQDGDGYYAQGTTPASECRCVAQGKYTALFGSDCDDSTAVRNPGHHEDCDAIDNDCNSIIDDGWNTYTIDSKGDAGSYGDLVLDKNKKVHIAYYDATNADLKYAFRVAGAWVTKTVDSAGSVGKYASIAADSSNGMHVSYYDSSNSDLKYATDATGSWMPVAIDTAGSVGTYSSIAVDSAGRVHISYYDNTNYDLKYVTNFSGSWIPVAIDTAGSVGTYSSIAVDSSGKVHISYNDDTNDDLKYATNASGSWELIAIDTSSSWGVQNTSIVVDSAKKVYIAYTENANNKLKYTTNVSGSWVISNLADQGEYASIVLDAANKMHISYYKSNNSDLIYATNTGSSWVFLTIDSIGAAGQYSSIAFDSAGRKYISYYDSTNYDLKIATFGCGTSCTAQDKDSDSYNDILCTGGDDCDDDNNQEYPGSGCP
jgi:hypothetical protein